MEMTVKEVLMAARAKIADPANWARGAMAYGMRGNKVNPSDPSACRFCSIGAIMSVRGRGVKVNLPIDALRSVMGDYVGNFNDTHTHADVLAKFDEAITAQGGK